MDEHKPKKKRRGRSEGSICQRPDGLWMGSISLGVHIDTEGNQRRNRPTVYGKSKSEVVQKLNELKGQVASGHVEVSKTLTGHYLSGWLEDTVRVTRKPKTYESYSDTVRLYIAPIVGHIPLGKLTKADCAHLAAELERRGYGPRVRQLAKSVLHKALERALELDLLQKNPAHKMVSPRIDKTARYWTAEEAKYFLSSPQVQNNRLYALFVLAIATGMRQGELLGLQWKDVDLARGLVSVRGTLVEVKGKILGIQSPKTKKGLRTIHIQDYAIRALKQHRAQAMATGQAAHTFVFPNKLGTLIKKSRIGYRFRRLVSQVGLPRIKFHDLRHTAATILLKSGVHPKVVQEMLGHSDIAITLNTYSHVLPTMQADAAKKMDEVLG